MLHSRNLISKNRRNTLYVITITSIILLIFRFYNLQITNYEQYAQRADANRIRLIRKEAPRGLVMDRNGRLLVDNQSSYTISVIPWEIRQSPESASLLCDILDYDPEKLKDKIHKEGVSLFTPLRIRSGIDFRILSKIEEHRLELPGVIYTIDPIRRYPSEVSLAHLLGYLREIGPQELDDFENKNYQPGDYVGWKGVEKYYESVLQGQPGFSYKQVDALGREIGLVQEKSEVSPKPGLNLYLTIDLDLQARAEALLEPYSGAVVLLDARNGDVLAFANNPDYDPELFAGVVTQETWNTLLADSTKPLYNRVIQGIYPPGSTFKIISAILALEDNIIDSKTSINCRGYYRFGNRSFKCWRADGHGMVTIDRAIVESCNVFFYHLIRLVSLQDWENMAGKFGFGQRTGIDLDEESPGILPGLDFMNKKYGTGQWTEGNKLNLVIGQGDILVTPLQMAKFAMILAQNGHYHVPHVAKQYYESNNEILVEYVARSDSVQGISLSTWTEIRRLMFDVVNSERGTGRAAQIRGVNVYGKTGTAQNPHGEPHAWFIGFVEPAPEECYAISVLIENGGSGGGISSVIAGKMFREKHRKVRQSASRITLK